MIYYLAAVIFIICAALAAAGIITALNLKRMYDTGFFTSMIFYQVFIFIFGFYGIWGQLMIRSYLEGYLEPVLFEKISNISLLSSYPFIILSWLIMLVMTGEAFSFRFNGIFKVIFVVLNVAILVLLGMIINLHPGTDIFTVIRYLYIIQTIIYISVTGIVMIMFPGKNSVFTRSSSVRLGSWILILMILQLVGAFFLQLNSVTPYLFILTFFLHAASLPVYIRYRADFSPVILKSGEGISFDAFCIKFEISRREEDIIREICNGLSNQEIADKLFISIKTVKGHLYRIYMKTNLRSRTQLITLVNSFT